MTDKGDSKQEGVNLNDLYRKEVERASKHDVIHVFHYIRDLESFVSHELRRIRYEIQKQALELIPSKPIPVTFRDDIMLEMIWDVFASRNSLASINRQDIADKHLRSFLVEALSRIVFLGSLPCTQIVERAPHPFRPIPLFDPSFINILRPLCILSAAVIGEIDTEHQKSWLCLAYTALAVVSTENEIHYINGKQLDKKGLLLEAIEYDSSYGFPYCMLAELLPEHPRYADKERTSESTILKDERISLKEQPMDKKQLLVAAININPEYARPYYLLGDIINANESVPLGKESLNQRELFLKAIALNPIDPMPYQFLWETMSPSEEVPIRGRSLRRNEVLYMSMEYGSFPADFLLMEHFYESGRSKNFDIISPYAWTEVVIPANEIHKDIEFKISCKHEIKRIQIEPGKIRVVFRILVVPESRLVSENFLVKVKASQCKKIIGKRTFLVRPMCSCPMNVWINVEEDYHPQEIIAFYNGFSDKLVVDMLLHKISQGSSFAVGTIRRSHLLALHDNKIKYRIISSDKFDVKEVVNKDPYYVVQLNTSHMDPLLERHLNEGGIEIQETLSQSTYRCKIVNNVDTSSCEFLVKKITGYPQHLVGPFLLDTHGEVELDVVLFENGSLSEDWFKQHQLEVTTWHKMLRIRLNKDKQKRLLKKICKLPQVRMVYENSSPTFCNDLSRRSIGIYDDDPQSRCVDQTGEGVVVGVSDDYVDENHKDFGNRIKMRKLHKKSSDSGHGTHVCGCIIGDGSQSGLAYQGVAPKARIYFQSILFSQVASIDPAPITHQLDPAPLWNLLEDAYNNDALIYNMSWGWLSNRHQPNAIENAMDEFLLQYQDMLAIVAAGNDGNEHLLTCTVNIPGMLLNGLTVGASCQDSNGQPNSVYEKSGRGANGYRIKPDIVAPGCNILSTKSQKLHNKSPLLSKTGTSQSAAFVSGCAALVREYFTSKRIEPSGLLVKATLINGANLINGGIPDRHQGFGRINLKDTIPSTTNNLKLIFQDGCIENRRIPYGKTSQFKVMVGNHHPLRVCLVWHELPSLISTTTRCYTLKVNGQSVPEDIINPNNVQKVIVDSFMGECIIEVELVREAKMNYDPGFAIVITGDLLSCTFQSDGVPEPLRIYSHESVEETMEVD